MFKLVCIVLVILTIVALLSGLHSALLEGNNVGSDLYLLVNGIAQAIK
jgi:hypothetical protein